MHLARAQVFDYKSFLDSGPISLSPHRNAIVGRNGTGKTSLTEALSFRFSSLTHRSIKTLPSRDTVRQTKAYVTATFELSQDDLIGMLLEEARTTTGFVIPLPWTVHREQNLTEEQVHNFAYEFFKGHKFTLTVTRSGDDELTAPAHPVIMRVELPYTSELLVSAGVRADIIGAQFSMDTNTRLIKPGGGAGRNNSLSDFGFQVAKRIFSRIYAFRAQRVINVCPLTPETTLHPSATNLAAVLANLQGNPVRFGKFTELVRKVFPHIQSVSTRHLAESRVSTVVWNHDPATEREDLAFPLEESGTGIGQVMAMLYVLVTAETPRILIIDEPQSFLHPGAAKALIDVMRSFQIHQFILATHSPTLLSAFSPETIIELTLETNESRALILDPSSAENLRTCLRSIGASFADVFGADQILWVEGRTEHVCFPLIVDYFAIDLRGAVIAPMRSTSDFTTPRSHLVFDLYDTISRCGALLPEPAAFLFDLEDRSQKDMDDLRRRSPGRVFFTDKPMFENYLLDPDALAAVINEVDTGRSERLTVDEVVTAIADLTDGAKLRTGVNGAVLLSKLFLSLTETRIEFDKVKHNNALTRWFLANRPGHLRPIAEIIRAVFPAEGKTSTTYAS